MRGRTSTAAQDLDRARAALQAIPPDLPREEWVRAGMAAHAAGLDFDEFDSWSAGAPNYDQRAARDTWRSFKPGRGIGAGTLFEMAKKHGGPQGLASSNVPRFTAPAAVPSTGTTAGAAAIFARLEQADAGHPYIASKGGVPDGLRVVPAGDPLRIAGVSMAGALVVPVVGADGEISSLQCITVGDTAAALKAQGRPTKLNLPGHSLRGWFMVGTLQSGATAYLCEGIGQAWACWRATGRAAVVCFGWGRVRTVAEQLLQRDPAATLVLVPDVGKEAEAEKVAADLRLQLVRMPEGWPQNADVNDLAQRDGADALEALLASPVRHSRPEARVLDFRALAGKEPPRRHWFVEGWLGGPTLLAARGGMSKSTLTQHLVTLGALGRAYFAPHTEPITALVVNCEDDHDELWRREKLICDHEGIDMAELAGRLHIVSRVGCENALMAMSQGQLAATKFMEELREQLNDLRADVLVLDNVAHLLLADHDDRTVATTFMNAVCGLVTGRPFAPIFVAHVSRAQGSEYTGSVAWENAVRMRWFLGDRLPDQSADDDEDRANASRVRFLCKRKSNYSAQDFVRFNVSDAGLLVPDESALQQGPDGPVSALDEKRAEQICLAGFKSLMGMGLHPADSPSSGDYLPRQIMAKGLGCGFTKTDMVKAMNRLMGKGVFSRDVVSRYSNRSPKYGLVLKEATS